MSQLVADLYETDHHVWALAQAASLRRLQAERSNVPLDLEHLAEEMEALARSDRNAVRSQVRRILEHLLKLQFSPAALPAAGWRRSIREARARLEDEITPTLRLDVEEQLERLYRDARDIAADSLLEHGEAAAAAALPVENPYTLDQVITRDWFPNP